MMVDVHADGSRVGKSHRRPNDAGSKRPMMT